MGVSHVMGGSFNLKRHLCYSRTTVCIIALSREVFSKVYNAYTGKDFFYCIPTRPLNNDPGEGNLSDERIPRLKQQQQRLLVQPEIFTELYFENFHLQNGVDADIQSAAEGFSALARARRGNPWPGTKDVETNAKRWASENLDGRNDVRSSGGSDDSGGKNGDAVSDSLAASLDLHESFEAATRTQGGNGDDNRSGGSEGNGNDNHVSGALEAFFEQYEGHAQEFASRSTSNFADANSKVNLSLVETRG